MPSPLGDHFCLREKAGRLCNGTEQAAETQEMTLRNESQPTGQPSGKQGTSASAEKKGEEKGVLCGCSGVKRGVWEGAT